MAVPKSERTVVLTPAGTSEDRERARSKARRLMIETALRQGIISLPDEPARHQGKS